MDPAFRDAVYQIVAAIPSGAVSSYGAVPRQAGFPRHARFVGRLMSQLPKDTRLPWHRVLRGDGRIALAGAPAGEIQILIVQELDRLARPEDAIVYRNEN